MRYTYLDLIDRLTNLRRLAQPPAPGEISGNFSSYDRRSQYDKKTDTYRNWDANDDGTGCVRTLLNGDIVALEMAGAGVIWRCWSALAREGHIRIYLNGAETPAVDMPFQDFFAFPGEHQPPLNLPEICPRLSRGLNRFIPIPFQNGIRIELAKGWGAYYHFTYTRFPEEIELPDYREMCSREAQIALAQADRTLYDRGDRALVPEPLRRETISCPPGEKATWRIAGGGAIARLGLAASHGYAGLLLRAYWDGEATPSVCAPADEFFGASMGGHRFRTWPTGMTEAGAYAHWYMPFADGARIEIENTGADIQTLTLETAVDESAKAENLLRFHALWHRGQFEGLEEARFQPGGDRFPDWPMLRVEGSAGRFVGVHLHVRDTWPAPKTGDEPLDWWWGEGDEKFFVDGEKFPSTFGTGSEDFIGYAWAAIPPFARFDSAYAAMPVMPIDGNGDTSVCRFFVCDDVPFQDSFAAYIEKYKGDRWGEGGVCEYAATAYWYQGKPT